MRCAHCGSDMADRRQSGYASVDGAPVCHPDDGPDCYKLVTLYKHPMPCACDGSPTSLATLDDALFDRIESLAFERECAERYRAMIGMDLPIEQRREMHRAAMLKLKDGEVP